MSDEQLTVETETEEDETPTDELSLLKQRARLMGIRFSNNISLDTLRQKIQEKMAAESAAEAASDEEASAPAAVPATKEKKKSRRREIWEENMRLVRVRITNLNPKKAKLPGEIFTVANEALGTVRKYIPYGEASDEGYHLPYCIFKQLKSRKFLQIRVIKQRDGQDVIQQNWVKEFALDVLPPLTPQELQKLAIAQKAAGNS